MSLFATSNDTIFSSNPFIISSPPPDPNIEKALHNYEIYHNLDEGSVNINELKTSCAGILGWAKSNNKIKLKIDDKIDIFLKEIEENIIENISGVPNSIIPQKYSSKKFSDGYSMGTFWFNCKLKKKLSNEPYIRLLSNDFLRYNYQKELSLNDKIRQFKEEVNYKNKIPTEELSVVIHGARRSDASETSVVTMRRRTKHNTDSYFSNGESMGSFWYDCKKYKKKYDDLLEIPILGNDYKNFSIEKNNINSMKKITYFINFVNNQGIIPLPHDSYKFSDDVNLGRYWLDCKEKMLKATTNAHIIQMFLGNSILKEDYNNYLMNKYDLDLIQKAKENYERFYNLNSDSIDIFKIHNSSAGIKGWATCGFG